MQPTGKRTVLVVDDDPYLVGLLSAFLLKFDFEILCAESAAEALKIAGQTKAALDLLITDIHMPEMNGIDLAQRIRQRRPKIKVIYISGDPNAEALVLVKDRSPSLLQKPFTLEQLEKSVRPVLAQVAADSSKVKPLLECAQCHSPQVRRSHNRIYDWLLLPFAVPYRCRNCRRRFYRVRIFGAFPEAR